MELSDEAIYTKLKDDLIRYATALVGPDSAEDVLSTVVLRTLRRRRLTTLRDPRPYLFRAVLNEARNTLRKQQPIVRAEEAVEDTHNDDREVVAAIRGLPPRQRAAIYLVYWEDMSIKQAANAMGARPGTVKRYVHMARNTLRGVLDEHRT
jgi:RNA polymerase sigma factor (sigma-70 family)